MEHGVTTIYKSRSVPLIYVKTYRMINRFYETLCKQKTFFDFVILILMIERISVILKTLSQKNDRACSIYP